jgi:hypothetical protein
MIYGIIYKGGQAYSSAVSGIAKSIFTGYRDLISCSYGRGIKSFERNSRSLA